MTTRAKELLLHKIVATSAFVFALCILPVAQYLLSGQKTPTQTVETGTVAGASTDTSIIEQSVPTPPVNLLGCDAQKQQDLASLQTEQDNWVASLQVLENKATVSYDAEIAALTGTADSIVQQTEGVNARKAQAIAAYEASINQEEASVSSQKNAVESRSCPAE